jgi:hypothetical protein
MELEYADARDFPQFRQARVLAAKRGWPKLRWPAPPPPAPAVADATVPVQRGLITLLFPLNL